MGVLPMRLPSFVLSLLCLVLAAGASPRSEARIKFQMEQQRMRDEHVASVAALNRSMTVRTAFNILRTNPEATPELLRLVQEVTHKSRPGSNFLGFVQRRDNPSGYAGLDKARNLLNDMLNEVNAKYDAESARCETFFNEQCALMETCRQDIAASNAASSDARSRILAAQAEINYCETHLPGLRDDLAANERMCTEQIADLQASLQIVLADIAVLVRVLEMTDCDAKEASFLQVSALQLMKCNCSGKTVVNFAHAGLQNGLAQLKSSQIRSSVMETLKALSGLNSPPEASGFETAANVTNFTNPPLPQTEVPPNPCAGISFDDAATDVEKCSLSSNAQCYKLQDKFLAIQSGIEDKRDELMAELEATETRCRMTKETLEGEISAMESTQMGEQEKLATATSQENEAGEHGRMKGEEHKNLADDMFSTRATCSTNMRTFESEQCSLKKIRGELYKVEGDKQPFFQDCQVSDWEAGECSVSCGGGTQVLTRSVTMQPQGGTECPPLEATQSCNLDACPVDCEVADWSGWSSCSADCNGGVMQRTRAVITQPMHGGEPCGETSESMSCNVQACDVDCVLADWSPWSNCSKACNIGTTTRRRAVLEAEVGQGTCAAEESHERFEEKSCNVYPCPKSSLELPLACDAKVDVILILDGSASIEQAGWDATVEFADLFVSAFNASVSGAQFALIKFSGPKTWGSYKQCTGGANPNVDLKETCGIDMVQHFSADLAATRSTIKSLKWTGGTTLTSAAMMTAVSELTLSRPDAPAVVVVVTDNIPLSPRKTAAAAKEVIAKGARLMMIPVKGKGLTEEGIQGMYEMVSEPKQDNFVQIEDYSQLDAVNTVDLIIADMCPLIEMPALR